MSDFKAARLEADTSDASDVVLWLDGKFAGNVGLAVQPAGRIFDIDADLALEIARHWNGFAALEAQIAAADALTEVAVA